ELVNAYPIDTPPDQEFEGHFIRFLQTVSGYLPIVKGVTLAGTLRVGYNYQLSSTSKTYPDRLFFLGGVDSMRGWLQDSFVPQECRDQIAADYRKPASWGTAAQSRGGNVIFPPPSKFTIRQVALRGANLMVNPRVELRFPLIPPLDSVVFADFGNSWLD